MALIWCAAKVVAFAVDLPNRILIDIDDGTLAQIVTDGTRAALVSDDTEVHRETLESFLAGIQQEPESIVWLKNEFIDEISELENSPNSEVAELASKLLAKLKADVDNNEDSAEEDQVSM